MNGNMLVAIAAVVIIAAAGAGVYMVVRDDGSDDKDKTIEPRDVEITNSLGEKVTVTAPVEKMCVVNSSAAEFLTIMGEKDRIVGMDSSLISAFSPMFDNVTNIGNYKTPSGEKIAETGCKYVITQSSSRSLSAETEQALKDNYQIVVLRLDFFGETMQQDAQELLKILISDTAEDAYNEYKATYDSVVNTVKESSKDFPGNPYFLYLFTSNSATAGTYYSTLSELSKIVESIHGQNAVRHADLNVTSTTATVKPAKEKVLAFDDAGHLDYVFVRGTASTTAAQDYQTFLNTGGDLDFAANLNVVANRHVYVINTDLVSGPRDYIGQVCICNAYGIDTGLDIAQLTSEFNNKYGFPFEYSYLMKQFPAAA